MDELVHAARTFKQAYSLKLWQLLAYVSACPVLCTPVIHREIVSAELEEGSWTRPFAEAVLKIEYPASFSSLMNSPQGEHVDKDSLAVLAICVADRILAG